MIPQFEKTYIETPEPEGGDNIQRYEQWLHKIFTFLKRLALLSQEGRSWDI